METLLKKLYQLSHESPTYSFRYQDPDCSEYRVEVTVRGMVLQFIGIVDASAETPEGGVEKCAQTFLKAVFDRDPEIGPLPCLSLLLTRWRRRHHHHGQRGRTTSSGGEVLMRLKIEEFEEADGSVSLQTSIKYNLVKSSSRAPHSTTSGDSEVPEAIDCAGYANAPALAYSLEHAALRVLLSLARDEPAEVPMEPMSTFNPQKASRAIISYHRRLAALDHGTFESGDGRDCSSFTFDLESLRKEGDLLVKSFFCQTCGRSIEDCCDCQS